MYDECRAVSRAAPEVERRCLAIIAGANVRCEVYPVGKADEEGLLGISVPDIQGDTGKTSRLGQPSFPARLL